MTALLQRPVRYRPIALARAAALLLGLACTTGTEPSTNPRDMRIDPKATATIWGYVYVDPAMGLPRRERRGGFRELARGVPVELGRWEERADPFQALGRRRVVIARTRTDGSGRYRFKHVPRYAAFSVQVQGSMPEDDQALQRWEAVTPAEIFWLGNTPERQQDVLIWDLSR